MFLSVLVAGNITHSHSIALTLLILVVTILCRGSDDVLYYSVRSTPSGGPRAPPLTGPKIESDLPTQAWDDRLLGQIDAVDSGMVSGWACLKGQQSPSPLQVSLNFMVPHQAHSCPAADAMLQLHVGSS